MSDPAAVPALSGLPAARRDDIAIIGAGAAGLATAIFLGELLPQASVVLVDGAKRPGAKILVSGGGRCNVTNATVSERDFWGGSSAVVKRVLRAFPAASARAWFTRLGVGLHEEEDGKLFPDSNRARDVLEALLTEAGRQGATLLTAHRVERIVRHDATFIVETGQGTLQCDRLVLATGGQSLPKSGSDGHGYSLARGFGHRIVPPTPALAPLVLASASPHTALSGVSHAAGITVWIDNRVACRLAGSLLWTHFGVSGPLALDASRHWTRAQADGRDVFLTLSFLPDASFEAADALLQARAKARPRSTVLNLISEQLPASVASAVLTLASVDPATEAGHLAREERRALAHCLAEWRMPVTGTRGYGYAEVTAGGVPLDEVNPGTLESRKCRGLYFAGEILDVDGRLGGFNFQWAWSSARVVAAGIAGGWNNTPT